MAVGFLAILPAVAVSALIMVSLAAILRDYTLAVFLFTLHRYFDMELLGAAHRHPDPAADRAGPSVSGFGHGVTARDCRRCWAC